jgi:hypothetical protein
VTTMSDAPTSTPLLACVVLAHTDPVQVRRLVHALDPFPVFLHCDVSTPDVVFEAMTTDLPSRCHVLPRMATGWARWENVEAELAGYDAALATGAGHVALLTGTDYPLASVQQIEELLRSNPGVSFARLQRLPYPQWRGGGFPRLRYRHWAFGKRMLRLPVPRRLPSDISFAGGSQLKVLSADHARSVLVAARAHPDLVAFFRRSWVPDETFIPSVLSTPRLTPTWVDRHVPSSLWWIDWESSSGKSPAWIGSSQESEILRRLPDEHGVAPVFARKFRSSTSAEVLDQIDRTRRGGPR